MHDAVRILRALIDQPEYQYNVVRVLAFALRVPKKIICFAMQTRNT